MLVQIWYKKFTAGSLQMNPHAHNTPLPYPVPQTFGGPIQITTPLIIDHFACADQKYTKAKQ